MVKNEDTNSLPRSDPFILGESLAELGLSRFFQEIDMDYHKSPRSPSDNTTQDKVTFTTPVSYIATAECSVSTQYSVTTSSSACEAISLESPNFAPNAADKIPRNALPFDLSSFATAAPMSQHRAEMSLDPLLLTYIEQDDKDISDLELDADLSSAISGELNNLDTTCKKGSEEVNFKQEGSLQHATPPSTPTTYLSLEKTIEDIMNEISIEDGVELQGSETADDSAICEQDFIPSDSISDFAAIENTGSDRSKPLQDEDDSSVVEARIDSCEVSHAQESNMVISNLNEFQLRPTIASSNKDLSIIMQKRRVPFPQSKRSIETKYNRTRLLRSTINSNEIQDQSKPTQDSQTMVVSLNFRRKLEEYKSVVYKSKEEILRRNINLYLSNQTVPHWMTREYGDLSKTRYLPLAQCKKLQKYAKKKHDIDSNIQEKSCGSNSKFKTELGQHRLMKSSKKSKMTHSNIEALRKQKDWMSDTYYSRLNINDLSKILGLDDYHISLTKEIEINILEIFRSVSDFKIGYQTWVRDTPKEKRKDLIENLYSYTCFFYPEIDTFKLEIIVRRGCYSLMQSRLRRERRQSTISSGTSKKR